MINMMNDFNIQRKHLLIKSPILDMNIFQNITINFEVTLEQSDGGELQEIMYHFFFLNQLFLLQMKVRRQIPKNFNGSVMLSNKSQKVKF